MERISIHIVDPRPMFSQGLRALFDAEPDFTVNRPVSSAQDTLAAVPRPCPDVVIWGRSISGNEGIELIQKIRSRCAKARVIVLSLRDDELSVKSAFAAGIDAYLAKESSFEELCSAIRAVMGGNVYISSETANKILNSRVRRRRGSPAPQGREAPTPREAEILRLVAQGYTSRQISEQLCISVKTVETHRSNLMRKLDVHSAANLTAFAIRSGLV